MKTLGLHRIVVLALMLVWALGLKSQDVYLEKANTFYETKQLDSAKFYIDRASTHSETSNNYVTWLLKGFIYKDLFLTIDKGKNGMSSLRLEGLNALKKAIMLDTEKEDLAQCVEGFKYFLTTMHNDVVMYLELQECYSAISVFRKSQEYYKIIDPSAEGYKAREVEFGLALGSAYNEMLDGTTDSLKAIKYRDSTITVFRKVLELDPNNVSANVGLAKIYYNQAVHLIKSLPYDDLELLYIAQDQSALLLKKAEPLMEKAVKLDPKREDALEGLAGIYFGLNEPEKSNVYRLRLKELKKNK